MIRALSLVWNTGVEDLQRFELADNDDGPRKRRLNMQHTYLIDLHIPYDDIPMRISIDLHA